MQTSVNPHLLRYTCQVTVGILLGAFSLKLFFLNSLTLFSDGSFASRCWKVIKRFRKGVWGTTLLQKGFPQLLDKHTPMNSDLPQEHFVIKYFIPFHKKQHPLNKEREPFTPCRTCPCPPRRPKICARLTQFRSMTYADRLLSTHFLSHFGNHFKHHPIAETSAHRRLWYSPCVCVSSINHTKINCEFCAKHRTLMPNSYFFDFI